MPSAEYWIKHLDLQAHPEGGFFKETYRSKENIPVTGLPDRFAGERSFSTSIYFLLRAQDHSLFHRIKSDELWHFHAGASLSIYRLDEHGLNVQRLGSDPEQKESLQVIVPANCWFGAIVNEPGGYTLSGCTVAPGFDFRDFELADRQLLLDQFPLYSDAIKMLTV